MDDQKAVEAHNHNRTSKTTMTIAFTVRRSLRWDAKYFQVTIAKPLPTNKAS